MRPPTHILLGMAAAGVAAGPQRPLALVIVGGMVTTTILTLLVLPVVFTWAHRRRGAPPREPDETPTAAMLP